MKAGLAAALVSILLCACGQAGPLVLPDAPAAPEAQQEQPQKKQEP